MTGNEFAAKCEGVAGMLTALAKQSRERCGEERMQFAASAEKDTLHYLLEIVVAVNDASTN